MTALNLGIQDSGNPEIWDLEKSKEYKFSKSKSVSPKMLARSGWVGQNNSRPHLGPFQVIFSMGQTKCQNLTNDCLFPLVGQWALFSRFLYYIWQGWPSITNKHMHMTIPWACPIDDEEFGKFLGRLFDASEINTKNWNTLLLKTKLNYYLRKWTLA